MFSAMLLTNMAGPDRSDNYLRHACLDLLPPILSGTAALLGPGPDGLWRLCRRASLSLLRMTFW